MYKLYYASTSPYVRKVMVVAHVLGLIEQIEKLDSAAHPIQRDERIARFNPLAKVPALQAPDGMSLYDSRVICEYLDSLHQGPKLLPDGVARWQVLRLAALADGLMDAALLARYERAARPAELQWPAWLDGQLGKVQRALTELEREVERLQGPLDLAQIGVACALGYLDFRFADLDWRAAHPGLTAFQQAFAQRASMQASAPL